MRFRRIVFWVESREASVTLGTVFFTFSYRFTSNNVVNGILRTVGCVVKNGVCGCPVMQL